eukprot:scaffold8881_cov95-Isochrysis_galbana.AAC.3
MFGYDWDCLGLGLEFGKLDLHHLREWMWNTKTAPRFIRPSLPFTVCPQAFYAGGKGGGETAKSVLHASHGPTRSNNGGAGEAGQTIPAILDWRLGARAIAC